jgi:predicted AAA+ superfamily ATPase
LAILTRISNGSKFENALFNQLRGKGILQYYSLKSGREIDFILDHKIALEIKERPGPMDLRNLENLSLAAGIGKSFAIGRYPVPGFINYIWGGTVR